MGDPPPPPPRPMDFNARPLLDAWNKWHSNMQAYIQKVLVGYSEETKMLLVRALIGPAGRAIYFKQIAVLGVPTTLPQLYKNFEEFSTEHNNSPADRDWLKNALEVGPGLGAMGAGAAVGIAGGGAAVGALGFGGGGIAAGSYAASMMSAAAVANGGQIAAGSLVATLQSIGAVGLGVGGMTFTGGFGALLGFGVYKAVNAIRDKMDRVHPPREFDFGHHILSSWRKWRESMEEYLGAMRHHSEDSKLMAIQAFIGQQGREIFPSLELSAEESQKTAKDVLDAYEAYLKR